MKLLELANKDDFTLEWNVSHDCHTYMKNDPMFYRKEYYPVMTSISDKFRKGESVDFAETLRPLVKNAMEQYCTKYGLDGSQSVFTEEDELNIIERIRDEEVKNIEEGEY
jgi:RNA polymerase-interacting CarD/CdnL/TRCF family regulator